MSTPLSPPSVQPFALDMGHYRAHCGRRNHNAVDAENDIENGADLKREKTLPGNTVSSASASATARPPAKKEKQGRNLRMQVFSFLNQPRVEVISTLAVLASSFLVALDTVDDLPPVMPNLITMDPHELIRDTLTFLNIFFAIDFFLRWYAAGNFKKRYLATPSAILDIVVVLIPLSVATIMPGIENVFGIPMTASALQFDSAGLQNLLLLRVFRLRRVLTDIKTFGRFEMALGIKRNDIRPYQLQLARVLLSIFTLLSVASGLIYTAEKDVNPNMPNYFSALYFSLTTLTTVGFGDVAPVTPQGKLVVCLSILAGVAVIPAQAGALVDSFLAFSEDRKKGGPRVNVTPKGVPASRVSSTALREQAQPLDVSDSQSSLAMKVSVVEEDEWVGWLGRCCLECEATDHREDAKYCWSCGSKL
jgi:hypothetical protein